MQIDLQSSVVRRVLLTCVVLVSLCGLAVELAHAFSGLAGDSYVMAFFDLSYEGNLPTWFSSCLLFSCGAALSVIAVGKRQSRAPFVGQWALLAVLFFYISLDELVQIHEQMNAWFDLGGAFYFGWIIPASLAVAVIGLSYLRFLAHLSPARRTQFIVAGAIYVTGALAIEIPLGYWAEAHGEDNLGYGLIDLIEESMELVGVSLFLTALLDEFGGDRGEMTVLVAAPADLDPAARPRLRQGKRGRVRRGA